MSSRKRIERASISQPNAQHHGFTLIEVLIALSLFSLLAFAAALMIDQSTRQSQLQHERSLGEKDFGLFWHLLEKDIAETVWRERKEKYGSKLESFYSTERVGALSWVTAGSAIWRKDRLQRQLQRVDWRLENGVIERLSSTVIDPAIDEPARYHPMLSGVKSWQWKFWYKEQWRTQIPNKSDHLKGLELVVEFHNGGKLTGRFSMVGQAF